MPTKKNPSEALAQSLGAAPPAAPSAPAKKVAQRKSSKTPVNTGVSGDSGRESASVLENRPTQVELSPGQVQVVSALVAQGFSYDEAVASLSGGQRTTAPAPGADAAPSKEELARIKKLAEGDDSDLPPVEDVEEKFAVVDVDLEKRDGFKTLLDDLWTRREEMADVPKKTLYRVTFDIPAAEFDWLLHRTIAEGQARKDVNYGVQAALVLLLKQQKALDPTRGGRRNFGGFGPKDAYNPNIGGWTK